MGPEPRSSPRRYADWSMYIVTDITVPGWAIWLIGVVVALFSALISSTVTSGVLYRAAKDKIIVDLKEIFARRSELNEVGAKVNALAEESAVTTNRSVANREDVLRLQEQWRPFFTQMQLTLQRFEEILNNHSNLHTKTATLLDEIQRRLDRQEHHSCGHLK